MYTYGLNVDDIVDVEYKGDGAWLISRKDQKPKDKIVLYKLEALGGEK